MNSVKYLRDRFLRKPTSSRSTTASGKNLKIIVGLGNPGRQYEQTRHNIGFVAVDALAQAHGIKLRERRSFRALAGDGRVNSCDVLLVKPQTFMNLSGESVRSIIKFYKLAPSEIIVLYDDIALPVGQIRIRERGSSGGQKGAQSIINCLGTDEFTRVRIGVGAKPEGWDLADYVLSKFKKDEQQLVNESVVKAANAVEAILKDGVVAAMNLYN